MSADLTANHLHNYRKDIDGLRSVAVLSVILFHLNAAWLSGGFLGVDIFFVISGFLITSILYRDIQAREFSFTTFYTRRIKRILPVFFVVLLVAMLLVYSVWTKGEAHLMGRIAMSAIGFASNFLLSLSGAYFDPDMEESIFLHLWSLSVEEQFYFVVPSVLIGLVACRYTRPHILKILTGMGILLFLSGFILKPWLGLGNATYYMPHLRFAEMLVGSLLAIGLAQGYRVSESVLKWLAPLSALVLLGCFFVGDIFALPLFPGPLALLPCLATAIILHPSSRGHIVSRFLSLKPMVWIGKISYSLYLWHWVVLAFFRYYLDSSEPLSLQLVCVSVVIMFVLSVLSYYGVEQPVRKMRLSFPQAFIFGYALPAAVCVGLFFGFNRYLPEPNWDPKTTVRLLEEEGDSANEFGFIRGDRNKEKPSVLVAGDSYTMHLTGFVDVVGKHEGWQAFVSYRTGTAFYLNSIGRPVVSEKDKKDFERAKYLTEHINEYDIIVLSAIWDHKGAHDASELQALDNTLAELTKAGKQVILVHSMYKVGRLVYRNIYNPKVSEFVHRLGGYPYPIEELKLIKFGGVEDVLILLKSKYPTVRWIDLTGLLPKNGRVGDRYIYPDKTHINHFASEWLGEQFIASGQRLIE